MKKRQLCRCRRCGKFTRDVYEVKTKKTIYEGINQIKVKRVEFDLCDQCYEEIAEGFNPEELDDKALYEELKKAVIAE